MAEDPTYLGGWDEVKEVLLKEVRPERLIGACKE